MATSSLTKQALRAKQARGDVIGTAPLGSRLVQGRLVPHEGEGASIARARELRAAGLSYRVIAEQLNAENMPARGAAWYHTTVARVLSAAP